MSEILHPDQTTKQPVTWACLNPICKPPLADYFTFDSDYATCPKCGAEGPPTVHKRVLIHFLIPDPKGSIVGQHSRWRLACDAIRSYVATHANGEAATGEIKAVNCPGCLNEIGRLAIKGDLGMPLGSTAIEKMAKQPATGFCC